MKKTGASAASEISMQFERNKKEHRAQMYNPIEKKGQHVEVAQFHGVSQMA